MSDSRPIAVALSPAERPSFVEAEPVPAARFDRDDLRWFAGAFVAGFLFFMIWLG